MTSSALRITLIAAVGTGALAVSLFGTTAALSDKLGSESAPDDPDAVQFVLPRCDTPGFYDVARSYVAAAGKDTVPPDMPALVSAPDLTDNQAHDCQRLLVTQPPAVNERGLVFGPLVSILVSTANIAKADFNGGVVVAEIVNHDVITYAPLGIAPNISCLWIRNSGGTWNAAIYVPVGGTCTTAPVGTSVPLEVHRVTYGTPLDTLYPLTGRWMWDARNNRQYIGIRCGYAWCEIGVPGFPKTTGMTQSTVPGWSDEQFMSHVTPGQSESRVSRLWGRIEPSRELRELTAAHFRPQRGAHVATIEFTGRDPDALRTYSSKFKASSTCGCANVIRIYMKAGNTILQNGASVFANQFSGDRADWTPIRQNSHTTHAGKGAVRWAWSEREEIGLGGVRTTAEEGAWVRCQQGCCRSDEECLSPPCEG